MNYKKILALLSVAVGISAYPVNVNSSNETSAIDNSLRYQSQVCFEESVMDDENRELFITRCIDYSFSSEVYTKLNNGEISRVCISIDEEDGLPVVTEITIDTEDFTPIEADSAYGVKMDNNTPIEIKFSELPVTCSYTSQSGDVSAQVLSNETIVDHLNVFPLNISEIEGFNYNEEEKGLDIKNVFSAIVKGEKLKETIIYWESKFGYHIASAPCIVDVNKFAVRIFNSEVGVKSNFSRVNWVSFNWFKNEDDKIPEKSVYEDEEEDDLDKFYETLSYRFCGFAPNKQYDLRDFPQEFKELNYNISGEYYLNTWGPVSEDCINIDPHGDA